MTHTDNPRRLQNVTRQMATDAARAGKAECNKRVFIWYANPRDGWAWDFEGSENLGFRNDQPNTDKLIEVK